MKSYNKLLVLLITLCIPAMHASTELGKRSLLPRACAGGAFLGVSITSFLLAIKHDDRFETIIRGCTGITGILSGIAAYKIFTDSPRSPTPIVATTDSSVVTATSADSDTSPVVAAPAFVPSHNKNFHLSDIAGIIPDDIVELVQMIKNTQKYAQIGATIPKGILLHGPGGTGKTSLARAVAGETNAAFFNISGSELNEIFIGVGAKRLRDLFQTARDIIDSKEHPYAIIFIDEIDALGGSRTKEFCSEQRNTLNELLNQMDGFNANNDIFVIGATNSIEILDKALLRPGRFDKLVKIDLPTETDRLKILTHYSTKIQRAFDDLCLEDIAHNAHGCSGAELKSLINEAALNAVRNNHSAVKEEDCYVALDKILTQKQYR